MTWWIKLWPAIPALLIAWMLHSLDVNRIEANQRQALETQKATLEKQCDDSKIITKEANDDLQSKYSAIAVRLKRLQQTSRCVVPASKPPVATASGNGHDGKDGITTDALREYAAECERYRSERITIDGFMDKVWASVTH